jgi:dTMP kinase
MTHGGLFLCFEGGEGAGKSTQLRRLAETFRANGHLVTTTREPGGTPGAEAIRQLILNGGHGFSSAAEGLLFSAARRDHVERLIRPRLLAGDTVLCDRFAASTRVYQGAAGNLPTDAIDALEAIATDGLAPELTILIDLPVEIGLARAAARRKQAAGDRFEAENHVFHERVRSGFLALASGHPKRWLVVDGDASEVSVAARINEGLAARGFLASDAAPS